jgi:hypothetical protein
MECFHHVNVDALAVCRHCGRGICKECAREGAGGLTCSEECAAEAALAHRVAHEAGRLLAERDAVRAELPGGVRRFLGALLFAVGIPVLVLGGVDGRIALAITGALQASLGLALFLLPSRVERGERTEEPVAPPAAGTREG